MFANQKTMTMDLESTQGIDKVPYDEILNSVRSLITRKSVSLDLGPDFNENVKKIFLAVCEKKQNSNIAKEDVENAYKSISENDPFCMLNGSLLDIEIDKAIATLKHPNENPTMPVYRQIVKVNAKKYNVILESEKLEEIAGKHFINLYQRIALKLRSPKYVGNKLINNESFYPKGELQQKINRVLNSSYLNSFSFNNVTQAYNNSMTQVHNTKMENDPFYSLKGEILDQNFIDTIKTIEQSGGKNFRAMDTYAKTMAIFTLIVRDNAKKYNVILTPEEISVGILSTKYYNLYKRIRSRVTNLESIMNPTQTVEQRLETNPTSLETSQSNNVQPPTSIHQTPCYENRQTPQPQYNSAPNFSIFARNNIDQQNHENSSPTQLGKRTNSSEPYTQNKKHRKNENQLDLSQPSENDQSTVKIKEEPLTTRPQAQARIIVVTDIIKEIRDAMIKARCDNNAQQNCGYLANYAISALIALVNDKPLPDTKVSVENSAATTQVIIRETEMPTAQEKNKTNKYDKHYSVWAVRNNVGLHSQLPPTMTTFFEGNNSIKKDFIDFTQHVPKVECKTALLNDYLKHLAKEGEGCIIGSIGFVNKKNPLSEAGHVITFFAMEREVFYIDGQLYNGLTKNGEPIFNDIVKAYKGLKNISIDYSQSYVLVHETIKHVKDSMADNKHFNP